MRPVISQRYPWNSTQARRHDSMELVAIAVWLVIGAFTAYVAAQRGANGWLWMILGVLFGPLALIAAFASGSGARTSVQATAGPLKKCPVCAEDVRVEARKCRFCGYQFPEPEADQPVPDDEEDPAPEISVALDSDGRSRREWRSIVLAVMGVALFLVLALWLTGSPGA